MTTIGYGDITPVREAEVGFVSVAMLIGVSFFALLVTQINELNRVVGGEVQVREQFTRAVRGQTRNHPRAARSCSI